MKTQYNENQAQLVCVPSPEQEVVSRVGRLHIPPFGTLLSEWTLCNIGHYCVLAVLSLYLLVTLRLEAVTAALLLFFASLAFRLARVLTAPLIDRLSSRQGLLISIILGCLGYLGMVVVDQPLLLIVLFALIGVGYGSNALIVKVLAGNERGASRLLRYASVNTGLNIGAVVGPIVGNTLFLHWNPHLLFFFPAGMFVLAGLVSLLFPTLEMPEVERGGWVKALGRTLRLAVVRQNLLFVFASVFLYSQLFATLPIVTQSLFRRPDLLSSFLVMNALIVVFTQIPTTRLMIALRFSPPWLLRASFLFYLGGFLLIWLLPYWQIAYPAIVLWTIGEMLVYPSLDTMMASAVPNELRITCFTLQVIAVAFGEGIGSLIGVWVIGSLTPSGQIQHLYLLFALFTCLVLVGSLFIGRTLRASSKEK